MSKLLLFLFLIHVESMPVQAEQACVLNPLSGPRRTEKGRLKNKIRQPLAQSIVVFET